MLLDVSNLSVLVLGKDGVIPEEHLSTKDRQCLSFRYATLGDATGEGREREQFQFDSRSEQLISQFFTKIASQKRKFDILIIAEGFEQFEFEIDDVTEDELRWCCLREIYKLVFSLKHAPRVLDSLKSIMILTPGSDNGVIGHSIAAWAAAFSQAMVLRREDNAIPLSCLTITKESRVTQRDCAPGQQEETADIEVFSLRDAFSQSITTNGHNYLFYAGDGYVDEGHA